MSSSTARAAGLDATAARPVWPGLMLATLGAIAFSGKAIIVKLAYRYGVDAVTLIMFRMLFALPLFVALAWWAGRGKPALTRRDWMAIVGLGFSGYYLASYLDFLGLQSNRHGPQEPIAVKFSGSSPITKGMADWLTGREELYNNTQPVSAFRSHTSLATGRQTVTNKKDGTKSDSESVVDWTNEYGAKKARVFATTLGHNNTTVEDARYLDLVARGRHVADADVVAAAGDHARRGRRRRVRGLRPGGRCQRESQHE